MLFGDGGGDDGGVGALRGAMTFRHGPAFQALICRMLTAKQYRVAVHNMNSARNDLTLASCKCLN